MRALRTCFILGLLVGGVHGERSTWRSRLFSEDWKPGHRDASGRFLHDFSYAGYRNGAALPDLRSAQYGNGYVIGTGKETKVFAPDGDWVEGRGSASDLYPSSLYEAQLERRTGRRPESDRSAGVRQRCRLEFRGFPS
ncbi:MAG: hypothetical protein ACYTG3_20555 [Planctomycetota bacterium]